MKPVSVIFGTPCPQCLSPEPQLLAGISSYVKVNYFLCHACGHIWTERKPREDPDETSFLPAVRKPVVPKPRLRTKTRSIRHR